MQNMKMRTTSDEISFSEQEIKQVEKFASEKFAPVLSLVMTDIVGSVIRMQEMGEVVYRKLKAEHHDKPIFDIISRDNKGCVIKNRGDGFMIVFSEPSTAVRRALEIQQYFREHGHFELRIGIAMGQCMIDWNGIPDIISCHANTAARAESICFPGHILVTRSVYESASNCIPRSVCSWKNHGFCQVKSGENFHEFIEPYNKNLIDPMPKPAKGTQSCVPTIENVFIFLSKAIGYLYSSLANYFLRCLFMLLCFFTKKPELLPKNSENQANAKRTLHSPSKAVSDIYMNKIISIPIFIVSRDIHRLNRGIMLSVFALRVHAYDLMYTRSRQAWEKNACILQHACHIEKVITAYFPGLS